MKYLIFNGLFPVIFSEGIKHSDVEVKINGKPATVTGAGFITDIVPDFIYDEKGEKQSYILTPVVEGESVSLNMHSKPEDSEIVGRMLDGEEIKKEGAR